MHDVEPSTPAILGSAKRTAFTWSYRSSIYRVPVTLANNLYTTGLLSPYLKKSRSTVCVFNAGHSAFIFGGPSAWL